MRSSAVALLSLAVFALSEGLTTKAEMDFASGFLQMLRMDHAPNVSCHRHDIPRYIINLYKGKLAKKPSDFEDTALEGSTTRILFPQDLNEEGNSISLQFNLSPVSFNGSKILQNAELHIQVLPEARGTVEVSIIRAEQSRESRNISDGDKDIISSRDCQKMTKHRWMVFNLTRVLQSEVKRHRGKLNVFISTTPSLRIGSKGKRKPFLVVSTEPDKMLSLASRNVLGLRTRQYVPSNVTENISGGVTTQAQKARNMKRTRRSEQEVNICRKRRLAVRFRDLKWNGWIIAPTRFGFHYCDGSCPGTLSQDSNPTNHAIMQNILHHRLGKKVPAATCVPTELHSMSLLYYDEDNTIVLRDVPNMVASNCGCR
ncbi:protein DVR-1 homolog [Orbicella faveolata]|uniref:protein DVR-1 homolog n=1 Tax=Orbicella faveolata TaxID=48498 RepID=UPI0009E50F47|nr:protein DVR-1 homolog [Orbicella faveolata]